LPAEPGDGECRVMQRAVVLAAQQDQVVEIGAPAA